MKRTKQASAGFHATALSLDARLVLHWDSEALMVAGVLYGIVATVVGVIVTPHGTVP